MNVELTPKEVERIRDAIMGGGETNALDVKIASKMSAALRNFEASQEPEEAAKKWQDNHGNPERWPTRG